MTRNGISFLGSNLHIWAEKSLSVTAQRIFGFVYFLLNIHDVSNECNLNEISRAPYDKYFVRNFTLHHFLLSPVVWNIRISINLTVMS